MRIADSNYPLLSSLQTAIIIITGRKSGMFKNWHKLGILLAISILLVACGNTAEVSPTSFVQVDIMQTSSAATVEAMTTAIVATDMVNQAATNQALALATPTLAPVSNQTPILPTPSATAISFPTAQVILPTPTLYPIQDSNCNMATFVDESIPDGSQFFPGTAFTKTWTLRNVGTCTWTENYNLVFVSGTQMSSATSFPLSDSPVAPGQTVTISLPLDAPPSVGTYRSDFKLRSDEGVIFAFSNSETTFWLEIQVRGDNINLADSYCSATWEGPTGELHCPGQPGNRGGFVYSDNRPVLENGYEDDETALWMGLYNANDAFLKGTYPAMNIPEGAKFSAILGCRRNNIACDVEFSINYIDTNGSLVQIAKWDEDYDDEYQLLTADLSAISGKQVKIVFLLKAKGSPVGDEVHLLGPKIKP